jgi:hypothetical protein
MTEIRDIATLERHYGDPVPAALKKVRAGLTPCYRRWIGASRFAILTTVGPDGTDVSPRGDDGPVVRIADDRTLLLPDWRGNNRIDSLRNIVRDGRVSLLFMVPGSANVVRVNGDAVVTADPETCGTFERDGKRPATVIRVAVAEVYYQCAKAIMRSGLWGEIAAPDLPSAGDFNMEVDPRFDGAAYDAGYEAYARPRLW